VGKNVLLHIDSRMCISINESILYGLFGFTIYDNCQNGAIPARGTRCFNTYIFNDYILRHSTSFLCPIIIFMLQLRNSNKKKLPCSSKQKNIS
jgi:hypothetical protein